MITTTVEGTLPVLNTDLAPVMAEIKDKMTKSILLNFAVGGRPNGWQPLKKTGLASHLTKTGMLKASISGESGENWAESGTSKSKVIYAAVHEWGYAAKNIPQRAYVLFQNTDIEEYKKMLVDHIIKTKQPVKI